jgi:ABC-type uncharacterized transport system YnjBCD substrate-binding protein
LSILESQTRRAWDDIETFNESWSYFRASHDLIWLQPGEEVPERERATIQCEKMMLTVAWNPTGFHVINVLGEG